MVEDVETASKDALRRQLLAARRRVADDVRAAEARLLSDQLEPLITGGVTVCAYVPVGTEPGSTELLDMLLRRSARVLLPVARTTTADKPLPLRWGEYRPGALVPGPWGLFEPPEPLLPETALAEASLVLVPALAGAPRGGRRGRGRGPLARLIAVVRDAEFVDALPAEPHDVPMTDALTPNRGLIALPSRE